MSVSQKTEVRPYVVRKSSAGLGLFAIAPIKKGKFIIQYTGEHITNEEADRRGGKYLFILNKKVVIDGKGRENTARYVNHSCRPNAEAMTDYKETIVRIKARRNIKEGEEITYDYGKEYWGEYIKPYGCRCVKCQEKGVTK